MKTLFAAFCFTITTILCYSQPTEYSLIPGNGNGLRFWNSDAFKIHMGYGAEYFFGPVTDYSIKMNMAGGSTRGWTWGTSGSVPVAGLSVLGHMQIAGDFAAGSILRASYTYLNNSISSANNWTRSNFGSNVYWDGANNLWQVGAIGNNDFSAMIHPNADGLAFMTGVSTGNFPRSFTNSEFMGFERMRINANGNVGIGTSAPSEKLQLSGNLRITGAAGTFTHGEVQFYRGDGAKFFSMGQSNLNIANSPFDFHDFNGNDFRFVTGTNELLRILVNGNIGIGTNNPIHKLQVAGGAIGLDDDQPIRGGGRWLISGNQTAVTVGTANTGMNLRLMAGGEGLPGNIERLFINGTSGNVGIGTTSPNQKLTVNGTIYGKEVKVDLNVPGPDYVFEKDYKLRTLDEIKSYIDANKHLPEVPSAKDMEEKGINLSEMNMILLRKIEELTLHLIEQNKLIEKLQSQQNASPDESGKKVEELTLVIIEVEKRREEERHRNDVRLQQLQNEINKLKK